MFLKWIFKLTGQIRVDRSSGVKNLEAIKTGVKLLKQGKVLCIFPEGGLKQTKEIRHGYTGVARFALLTQTPIVPIGIKNSFDIFPCHKKFPNFKKVCEVKIGKPLFFKEYYSFEHNTEMLQEITDRVIGVINNLIK